MKFLIFLSIMTTSVAAGIQAAPLSQELHQRMAFFPLVTWGSFSVGTVPNFTPTVLFSWSTTSETNVARFEVQRYHWTTGWQTLGFVTAGAGTYGYFDVGLIMGETYQYRVAAVSPEDQRGAWSPVQEITVPEE